MKGQIGKGGFSHIYKCIDSSNIERAVKCLPIHPKTGVSCLFECICMTNLSFLYLNSCLNIGFTINKIYLIQELAICDLFDWRKKNSDLSTIPIWISQVLSAIFYLHSHGIIHGDIKASNVLLYSSNNIKLTDFSLSLKEEWMVDNFSRQICTSSHRPLEVWLGKKWNRSVDIWSFGCFIYELLHGSQLFPSEMTFEERIENFKNWEKFLNGNGEFKNFSEKTLVNDLLINILQIDVEKRFTLEQIKNHKYLSDYVIFPVIDPIVSDNKITIQKIPGHIPENVKINISKLYDKIVNLKDISNSNKLKTCIHIYKKMIRGESPLNPNHIQNSNINTFRSLDEELNLVKYERLILKYVLFDLVF